MNDATGCGTTKGRDEMAGTTSIDDIDMAARGTIDLDDLDTRSLGLWLATGALRQDPDVGREADWIAPGVRELLWSCEVEQVECDGDDPRRAMTDAIVREWVPFVACPPAGVGGSNADYAAWAVGDALAEGGLVIALTDDGARRLVKAILDPEAHAIAPMREVNRLVECGAVSREVADEAMS